MASLSRLTTGRAVHLRIHPRPLNIGESREILRLISQFGEVEYFKNLKYDVLSAPQTALVIFKGEDAATACLKRSPIRFRLGPAPPDETVEEPEGAAQTSQPYTPAAPAQAPPTQPRGPNGAPFGMAQSRSLSTVADRLPSPPRKQTPMPFIGDRTPPPPQPSRVFQLSANVSRAKYRDQIDVSHYHSSFKIDRKSAIQQNLERKVPLVGLSCWDWRIADKPWRLVRNTKEEERDGPNRRKSLRELYEEGLSGGRELGKTVSDAKTGGSESL